MPELSKDLLKKTLKNLIFQTNISVGKDIYSAILEKYHNSDDKKYSQILQNLEIARTTQRPICQDTGVCIFFVEIGRYFPLSAFDIKKTIEESVAESYKENFFRKSMAKSILNRSNTEDNTPAVIYIDITEGDNLDISLEVKGGGSENVSALKMLSPSAGEDGVIKFIQETLASAKDKGCPPYVVGVGLGGTIEKAAILSKKALMIPVDHKKTPLEIKIKNSLTRYDILGVNVLEFSTHIASMAVSVNLCCHCCRHGRVVISSKADIEYCNDFDYELFEDIKSSSDNVIRLSTSDCSAVKRLKKGDRVLLSGEIYTARDMAHKRIFDTWSAKKTLPVDLKDKIIFYAGPCPSAPGEVIGPVGPTTSARMDKYLDMCKEIGILATIGKGERTVQSDLVYFTTTGGVACLLQKCIKSSQVVAYEDLGPEAIFRLEVSDFPVEVF